MAGSTPTAQQLAAAVPGHLRRCLHSARELERRREEGLRTRTLGVEPLDRLLGGQVQRGRLIELVGRPGGGRFSLAVATLAAVTSCGETAALIDLGDMLDPENAAALGVALERLLWARPDHLKPALHAAESIIGAGFPLVVLDLGVPPVPGGRGTQAAWLRLARAAARQQVVLIVSAPYRVSGTAAATVLRAGRGRSRWSGPRASPPLLTGIRGRVVLDKARHHVAVDTSGGTVADFDLGVIEAGPAPFGGRSSGRLPAATADVV